MSDNGFGCFEIINFEDMYVDEEKEVFYRVSIEEIDEIKKRVIQELKNTFRDKEVRNLDEDLFDEPHDDVSVHFIYSDEEQDEEPHEEPNNEPHEESNNEPPKESNNEPPEESIEGSIEGSIEESIEESDYESADSIDDDKTVFNIKISQIHINEIKEIKNLKPKKTIKIIKNNNNKILMIAGLIAFGVAIHI